MQIPKDIRLLLRYAIFGHSYFLTNLPFKIFYDRINIGLKPCEKFLCLLSRTSTGYKCFLSHEVLIRIEI